MASIHAKQSNNNYGHSRTSDDSEEDDHSTFSRVSKGTNDEYVVRESSSYSSSSLEVRTWYFTMMNVVPSPPALYSEDAGGYRPWERITAKAYGAYTDLHSNIMPSIHDTHWQSDDDDNMSRASNVSMDDGNPITTRVSESQDHSVHAAQIDDDDSHSSTSDDSEDDDHSRASRVDSQPDDGQQPEVQNSTSYSRRRQRKSRRKTMGIHCPEYVVRGSDPFDYEQKFPEDKRYEEMGPTARVWRTFLEECGPFDLEMVEGWRDALDVLLVFAGLFSAVVSTFVAQTSQSLQVDYGQVTATLLIELIDVQRSVANGSLVNDIPRSDLTFHPSTSDSWVNGLWFTSLSLSLSTALFAVLTKQWIHQYMSVPSGTPRDRCRLRQFRYMGLQRWGVDLIIGLLPVLMSASLAVFLVGLVLFIIPLRVSIASVVGSVTFIAFSAYLITNFLPILYPSCPYKTPLSQYIFPLYTYITHDISFKWIFRLVSKHQSASASEKPAIRVLKDAEIAAVKRYADETDVHALSWLYSMSSNPSVQSIVIQSTSALPLTSVVSLLHHIDSLSSTCLNTLYGLLSDASDDHSALESKIDRVSRAFLRFPGEEDKASVWNCSACVSFHLTSHLRGYFSPDVYAQLLCLRHGTDHLDEIWELLLSNLSDEGMELEPIVWARLLHKVLPFGPDDRDIAQHFFKIIPSNYWKANFVVPPPVYEWEDIKIIENANNQSDRLTTTFCDSLYPWVGEGIFQGQLNITDSIFNPESPDDYPSPQDPKLRFLLTMVGSRSAIVLPNAFCQAISNIEAFCGYTMLFYWDHPLLSIVELSSHRHAILKLLYTLLSSDHFGKKEVPVEHQRAALALFLRMVKSTSPRPPFMARDWCTPDLAAEFVRIAFEDGAWAPMDAFDNCPDIVSELIHLLIQFPPIMSQAFEYAVAKRLFDRLIEAHYNRHNLRSSYYVLQVLKMFIDGLPSSKLESQISRNFLGYLHEPDVLFAVCAFLVGGGFSEPLHDLARLRPNDPTWPVCIQRLREYVYRPAGVPDGHERPGILADLTAFLEGGGVGPFGSQALPAAEYIAQVDDSPPVNHPMDPLRNAWRRIRGYITKDTAQEDIGLSSIESSSVFVFALIRSYVDELSVTNACVPHILGCIVELAIFNVKAGAIVVMNDRGKDT
ncbi:uncharacterized protein ARMOST_07132 [Armillaria ostoyae]|uniref:DUF6535 domain-containing protein n=1 Tax=Armillaria ostoyae TaxID=47428 RepID=A0A284R4Y9_ARMOS|nr:uncharacterized protein ARMOST_07132 [Armillaria ostoyae]